MPIVFKCICGLPGMAPDEAAGQQYTCATCGHSDQIPSVSDPDCVLVYKNGVSNDGVPLTLADFEEKVRTGQYRGNDLIFHEGQWLPIASVFELPPQPQVADEATCAEIALHFSQLPPMKGFTKLGSVQASRKLKRLWAMLVEWINRQRSTKYKSKTQKIVYYTIILLFLCLAYCLWIGKLVNYILWRPVNIVVYNPTEKYCTASCADKEIQVAPGLRACLNDIILPIHGKKKLRIIDCETKEVLYETKVPLKPFNDVLVNPNGKLTFDAYDMSKLEELRLHTDDVATLKKEICSNSPPKSARDIVATANKAALKICTSSANDELFFAEQYNLSAAGLQHSADHNEHMKYKVHENTKPVLVCGSHEMNGKDLKLAFDKRTGNMNCEFTLELKETEFPVTRQNFPEGDASLAFKPANWKASIQISKNGNVLAITSNPREKQTVTFKSQTYIGTWIYTAKCAAPNKWISCWTFTGQNKSGTLRLMLNVNADGSKTAKAGLL